MNTLPMLALSATLALAASPALAEKGLEIPLDGDLKQEIAAETTLARWGDPIATTEIACDAFTPGPVAGDIGDFGAALPTEIVTVRGCTPDQLAALVPEETVEALREDIAADTDLAKVIEAHGGSIADVISIEEIDGELTVYLTASEARDATRL